jgi:four helix bundle protein
MKKQESFKEKLKRKMDEYVQFIYVITRKFPKDELFGATSQIRRSSLSIILNYIEGFARRKPRAQLNFLEISYGSLKESCYLLYFSQTQHWISEHEYNDGLSKIEEIGAMLWTEIHNLDKHLD